MSTVDIRVFENPLPGIEPHTVTVEVGTKISDAVMERAPFVCLIDGVPMKREYWRQREVCEGDHIELHCIYLGGGRGGSRSILGAIAMIALAYFAPMWVASWQGPFANAAGQLTALGRLVATGLVLIGNALISAVIRTDSHNNQPDKGSSVYSVDTQGNQAKLFNPIPVQYGRVKAFPDYACQPYVRYRTDTDPAGDQYYYALFCLGQGEYEIESIQIADADISSFQDVLVARILPPGQRPTHVNTCVVTSEAVSGQVLDNGQYVGPFPVCGPTRRTSRISIDIVFPQGLCTMDDRGKAGGRNVLIAADVAPLSDAGVQTGPWSSVFQTNISAASLTPQRRTFDIAVPAGRYTIRIRRGDVKDPENNRDVSSCQWAALRAELIDAAPLCDTATHFELVMRASEQLSSLSQRKISIISTRKVKDFQGNLVPSRSPLLALRDKWQDNVYGDGMPADRVDVETLKILDALAESRKDRFDYRFESRVTSEEADQLIAKVIRSVALQRNGVKTVVRDGPVDLPMTMFNATNITEGSASIDYVQVTEETADGVIGEFFSQYSWMWEEVECPAPGFTYTSETHPGFDPSLPRMQNPARVRFDGITQRHHAEREGTYLAYTNALRRRFVGWKTEMQGILLYYGCPVMFSSTLYNSDAGGEIIDYRDSDGAIRLSDDVSNSDNTRLVFMNADGSTTRPVSFTALGDGWVLLNEIIFANWGDYASERTRYIILKGEMNRHLVKVLSLQPRGMGNNGAPEYELRGVIDVPEVHTADERFLPGEDDPEDIPWQDPYLGPPVSAPYINLGRNGTIFIPTRQAVWPGSGYPASLVFYPDGRFASRYYGVHGKTESNHIVDEWSKHPIKDNPNTWVSDTGGNVGSAFEIALAFDLRNDSGTLFSKIYIDVAKKYMWMSGDAPPDNNLIMQGRKVIEYTLGTSNYYDSTEVLVRSMRPDLSWNRQCFVTQWEPVTSELEYRSFWKGFPMEHVQGDMFFSLNAMTGVTGYIGIRDKASKTIQQMVPFETQYSVRI